MTNRITHWHNNATSEKPRERHVALRYYSSAISPLKFFWDPGDLAWRAVIDTNAWVSDDLVREWSYVDGD